mgnify:CR=1 FL=1
MPTLLAMLATLMRPTSGRITYGTHTLESAGASLRSTIGILGAYVVAVLLIGVDDGAFNPNEEQVAFYLENVRGVNRLTSKRPIAARVI